VWGYNQLLGICSKYLTNVAVDPCKGVHTRGIRTEQKIDENILQTSGKLKCLPVGGTLFLKGLHNDILYSTCRVAFWKL
jgi:hypothetical protein